MAKTPLPDFTRKADLARLRRIALGSQGLTRKTPFGRGAPGTAKAIDHLGYIQIDTISVVERAHHHVLRTRVPNYTPKLLDRLLKQRQIFEHWAHAAAFLPMQDFRYSLPFKNAIRSGRFRWFRSKDKQLMQDLLQRIDSEGPLRSRDVEDARGNGAGWWDWKPAKQALEQLYMQGDLMVCARDGFQKTYDLPANVIPDGIDTSTPTANEYAIHLIDQTLRCHGFVSQKGMTYVMRDDALRKAAKEELAARLADKQLVAFTIQGSTPYYTTPSLLEQTAPAAPSQVKILSPFDNSVIQRERLQNVFAYDYQIECYVPEAKRQYGYFCLPILFRDQFVGRMDCKAHRDKRLLEIKQLFIEGPTAQEEFLPALATSLQEFCDFQGCETLSITSSNPAQFKQALTQHLARHT